MKYAIRPDHLCPGTWLVYKISNGHIVASFESYENAVACQAECNTNY